MILWKLEIIISIWLKYFSIAMTSSFVAKAHKAVWSQRPFEPSVPSKFAQLSEIKCKKRTLDYNCFLQSQKQSLWFWSILIIWASGRVWVQTTPTPVAPGKKTLISGLGISYVDWCYVLKNLSPRVSKMAAWPPSWGWGRQPITINVTRGRSSMGRRRWRWRRRRWKA